MTKHKAYVVIPLFVILSVAQALRPEGGQNAAGTLRGAVSLPAGLNRPPVFLLAYSSRYGAKELTVTEKESNANFEAKLMPGTYYIVMHVDGFEPTCRLVRIDAGKLTEYSPGLGSPVEIEDVYGPQKTKSFSDEVPIDHRTFHQPSAARRPN